MQNLRLWDFLACQLQWKSCVGQPMEIIVFRSVSRKTDLNVFVFQTNDFQIVFTFELFMLFSLLYLFRRFYFVPIACYTIQSPLDN